MKEISYICFFIIFVSGCIAKQQYNAEASSLSNEIYKEQLKVWDNEKFLKVFEYNRNQVGWTDDIKKLNNDTVYIIEEHNYSDEIIPFQHNYYAVFWNKKNPKDVRSYSKKAGGEIKVSNGDFYSQYYKLNMINEWDMSEFKKKIEPDSNIILGGDINILITRIIKIGDARHIESIYYKGFL